MDIERVEAFMKRVEQSERETFAPVGQKLKVGVDLGTNTRSSVCWTRKTTPWPVRSRRLMCCGTG